VEENNAKIEYIHTANESSESVPQTDRPIVDESIDDVGKSTIGYLKRHMGYVAIAVAVTLILEALLFFWSIPTPHAYFLPLLILIIGYSQIKSRVQHEFMRQFAAANNFTYSIKGSQDGLDGALFKIGHSQSVTDVVSGNYGNCPIVLFLYKYVTGSGRDSQTHYYTVFELQFNTKLPDMLLEKKGDYFGDALFGKIAGKKYLQLEGDFNKYFNLSLPEGYEIEALEVFTPDVMAALIDKAKSFSLEIINSHLFIYAHTTIGKKQELYAFYDLAEYFVQKLGPVLTRMGPSAEAMGQAKFKQNISR